MTEDQRIVTDLIKKADDIYIYGGDHLEGDMSKLNGLIYDLLQNELRVAGFDRFDAIKFEKPKSENLYQNNILSIMFYFKSREVDENKKESVVSVLYIIPKFICNKCTDDKNKLIIQEHLSAAELQFHGQPFVLAYDLDANFIKAGESVSADSNALKEIVADNGYKFRNIDADLNNLLQPQVKKIAEFVTYGKVKSLTF